jgi:2-keto-4-pentenoate hydratase
MTPSALDAAALHLLAARRRGRPGSRLLQSSRPSNIDDALAIQRRVALLLGEPVGGWKCSLPTTERILVAPIYAAAIGSVSPRAVPTLDGFARIEPEVAFVLAKDLPRRTTPYSEAEVRAAVGEIRLVLELIGSRYVDPSGLPFPEMLADGANNYGLHIGPAVQNGLERALEAIPLTIRGPAGAILTRDGVHPDGHPLRPLVWLANWFGQNSAGWDQGISAGQIITTGSYAGALDVPFGTPLTVTFGDLGELEVMLFPTE